MRKFLASVAPQNTSITSLYTPAAGLGARNLFLYIANYTVSDADYSLLYSNTTTPTGTDTEWLYNTITLTANSTVTLTLGFIMDNASAEVAVQNGTGDSLTYMLFGEEFVL
jgi:hypothetical protein